MSKVLRIFLVILAVLAVMAAAFFIYAADYYHADSKAETALAGSDDVTVEMIDSSTIAFVPADPVAGMIFYPGGKVEYTAYAPLMLECAEQGILCILVRMPFNLAVFGIDKADGLTAKYPEVSSWYMCGHSLGGATAALYVSKHTDDFSGLVLLAAYSTADLTESGLKVLSIYGSEDGVLAMDKYSSDLANLPADHIEYIIDGGCHSGFGSYGAQSGDGTPSVTAEYQQELTAEMIARLVR